MAADFPARIWIREPAIEGRPLKGGALNRAMALLAQAGDEITAIETTLGTDPAGSATDLLSRLGIRHARSGLRRGALRMIGDPNAGWFDFNGQVVQIGKSSASLFHGTETISFGTAYSVAPSVVLVRPIAKSTNTRCGNVELKSGSITTTGFQVLLKMWSSTSTWVDPNGALDNMGVIYMAIGGS